MLKLNDLQSLHLLPLQLSGVWSCQVERHSWRWNQPVLERGCGSATTKPHLGSVVSTSAIPRVCHLPPFLESNSVLDLISFFAIIPGMSNSLEPQEQIVTGSPEGSSEGELDGTRDWRPSRIPLKRSQGLWRAKSKERSPGAEEGHMLASATFSAQTEHLRDAMTTPVLTDGRPISASEDDISYMLAPLEPTKLALCKTTSLGSMQPDVPVCLSPPKSGEKGAQPVGQGQSSRAGRSMSAMSKSVSAIAASATSWSLEKARKGSAKGLSEFKRKASHGLIRGEKQSVKGRLELNLLRNQESGPWPGKCTISDDCCWRPPLPSDFAYNGKLADSPTRA